MPSRVQDYDVLYTIGSGSYGKCQKIRRRSDGKVLVWKALDYGTMAETEKQMLVSEVNLLRELKHPNIVRYHDRIIDRSNTTLYIVMEYCEGGDLASLINTCFKERRYLEEEFVVRVLAQLSLALSECHRHGGHTVLHRDLKPANVFLDAEQNVKLGDFGLARILNHDTSFAKTFVGTPYYMSPEQMNCQSYNEKSDIWSLGCLVYELCALSPPFTAYNQKDLAEKIREGKFRRIPYRYSEELNVLLSRMLNVKCSLRPSVEALVQNELLAVAVQDEQSKRQAGRGQKKWVEPGKQWAEPGAELRLQDRERALREREERLERREQELCVRERMSEEKLARAEALMRNLAVAKQLNMSPYANERDVCENTSPGRKKVHFAGDSKENQNPLNTPDTKTKELKVRLQTAKSRHILAIR